MAEHWNLKQFMHWVSSTSTWMQLHVQFPFASDHLSWQLKSTLSRCTFSSVMHVPCSGPIGLIIFLLLFLMNKTQSRSTTFSRWTSCEMHHKMGYELNWFYRPWGKRNGGRSSFKWVLNLDWMSKMWSHCMKEVGDWFSSCEENIILHTLQSIRFWNCIFCFLINLILHQLFFFFGSIFSSEIERAEFQYECQITSLCARKPNIVFIDHSWEYLTRLLP